jgi:hypothetical protein
MYDSSPPTTSCGPLWTLRRENRPLRNTAQSTGQHETAMSAYNNESRAQGTSGSCMPMQVHTAISNCAQRLSEQENLWAAKATRLAATPARATHAPCLPPHTLQMLLSCCTVSARGIRSSTWPKRRRRKSPTHVAHRTHHYDGHALYPDDATHHTQALPNPPHTVTLA